ncbi:MAG: hypothetical protein ACOY93_06335 [Bacillota bacterium]
MRQFFFVDDAGGEEAELAASILADCLQRQGYPCLLSDASVTMEGPGSEEELIFLLLEESLLDHPLVRAHLDPQSLVVVCSARPARVVLDRLGGQPAGVVTVDAAGIAFEAGADPVTALLGGAARAAAWIDPDVLCAAIWASYDREFAYGARAALRAFDQGYVQAQQALATPRYHEGHH